MKRKPYWETSDPANVKEFDTGQFILRYYPCTEVDNDGVAKLQILRRYVRDGIEHIGKGVTLRKDDFLKYPGALEQVVKILTAWHREA